MGIIDRIRSSESFERILEVLNENEGRCSYAPPVLLPFLFKAVSTVEKKNFHLLCDHITAREIGKLCKKLGLSVKFVKEEGKEEAVFLSHCGEGEVFLYTPPFDEGGVIKFSYVEVGEEERTAYRKLLPHLHSRKGLSLLVEVYGRTFKVDTWDERVERITELDEELTPVKTLESLPLPVSDEKTSFVDALLSSPKNSLVSLHPYKWRKGVVFHEDFFGGINLKTFRTENYPVHYLISSKECEVHLSASLKEKFGKLKGASYTTFTFKRGFYSPAFGLALVGDRDVQPALTRSSDEEISVGDYVVHENYGVGKLLSITERELGGKTSVYLRLEYAEQIIEIPISDFKKLHKYVSPDGVPPSLDSGSRKDWEKKKKKLEKKILEYAAFLHRLYLERRNRRAPKMLPDEELEKEFRNSFPHEETVDQVKAISETLSDLEKNYPADRLICGDVGFGKTEVALRAAFRAVINGYQVIVLVPTTILAMQHYYNFSKRFSRFGISVDMVSRLRTKTENKSTIERFKSGKLDVIVGTHKLLSADLSGAKVGLIVVDEEQRFGVKQKEKLRETFPNAHLVMLSATPIPRTLYLSLIGIKDISVITTPPEGRKSVETFVGPFDWEIVKNAVERELERGGSVFYVLNDISKLEERMFRLRHTLHHPPPMAVVHGRSSRGEIEEKMLKFINGEYKILVTTTIVENGLDIQHVDTLVVEGAERMGLAQMHQLRGRVGRGDRKGYSYFLFHSLSEESEDRLRAIYHFSFLGSGYPISFADMNLRGVGEVLGTKQHGVVKEVGVSMYTKMLRKAVAEMKGESLEDEVPIDLYDGFIPRTVPLTPEERVKIYTYIYASASPQRIREAIELLRERVQRGYPSVKRMIDFGYAKILARELDIRKIEITKSGFKLTFSDGREEERPSDDRSSTGLLKLLERIANETLSDKQKYTA